MNEIVTTFLLAWDKFLPGFAHSACAPFTKKQGKNKKNSKTQEIH